MDFITVTMPACPRCSSTKLRTYKTMPPERGDGSIARYTQCIACAHRFKIVSEPVDLEDTVIPAGGNAPTPQT